MARQSYPKPHDSLWLLLKKHTLTGYLAHHSIKYGVTRCSCATLLNGWGLGGDHAVETITRIDCGSRSVVRLYDSGRRILCDALWTIAGAHRRGAEQPHGPSHGDTCRFDRRRGPRAPGDRRTAGAD